MFPSLWGYFEGGGAFRRKGLASESSPWWGRELEGSVGFWGHYALSAFCTAPWEDLLPEATSAMEEQALPPRRHHSDGWSLRMHVPK